MRVAVAQGPGYYLAPTRRAAANAYGDARTYLLVDAGYANPIVALSNRALDRAPDAPYAACHPKSAIGTRDCQFTFQLSLPVAFYLYWDAFTANEPIIDTDYTFGIDLSGRVAPVRNIEVRASGYLLTHWKL